MEGAPPGHATGGDVARIARVFRSMSPLSRITSLVLGLAALAGCGSPPSDPGPGPDATSGELVVDRDPGPIPSDAVAIDRARIEGDELILSLRHSGGCRGHRFALHLFLPVPLGETPILDLSLSHDADGDPCEALLMPVLRIDLRPLQAVIAPRRSATLRVYRPGAAAPSAELRYTF
jgi:hypothetical protein